MDMQKLNKILLEMRANRLQHLEKDEMNISISPAKVCFVDKGMWGWRG